MPAQPAHLFKPLKPLLARQVRGVLAYSQSTADAIAQSVEVASMTFFAEQRTSTTATCFGGTTLQSSFSTKLAQVLVCAMAAAYGQAYSAVDYQSSATSCALAQAFSGLGGAGGTATCSVTPVCPCPVHSSDNTAPSTSNLVQNPSFETGDFSSWTFSGETTAAVYVLGGGHSAFLNGAPRTMSQTISGLSSANDAFYQLIFTVSSNVANTLTAPNTFAVTLRDANGAAVQIHNAFGPYAGPSYDGHPVVTLGPVLAPGVAVNDVQGFDWTKYIFTFAPLSSAVTIEFTFGTQSGYFVLDDVSLRCTLAA